MKLIIIGGGIGGLTTAIGLQQSGIDVQVYEAAPVLKPLGAGIVLAANAMKAFQTLGIHEAIAEKGKVLENFCICDDTGRVLTQTHTETIRQQFGLTHNFTIHRAELHDTLVRHLKPDTLQLGKKAMSYQETDTEIRVSFQDGTTDSADGLIVADGIHSLIRQQVVPESTPRYAGYTCWRAVIDATGLAYDATQATETWGAAGRIGIVPLSNNRIYTFICINAPAQSAQHRPFSPADLHTHFKNYHSPIPAILERIRSEQLIHNDILDLKPLTQFAFGRLVLLGDAAHATTPNMGQGACQAIEDAAVLMRQFQVSGSVTERFRAYEQRRLKRTTWVINQSRQLGVLAQLENSWGIALRNTVFRMLPKSANTAQFKKLFDVELE